MNTTTTERPHGADRYRYGCRCHVCVFDNSQERAAIRQLKQLGQWQPWTDAELVREHVRGLLAAGFTRQAVAIAARVDQKTIAYLLHGKGQRQPTRRARTHIARRILGVSAESPVLGENTLQSTTGSVRRIQALCAIGWSLAAQGKHIGWGARNHVDFLAQTWVRTVTASRISRLYDQFSMTTAPASQSASRARNDARRKGWFPPLAWDDDTIDDRAALPVLIPPPAGADPHPDELAIQHRMAGHDRPITREGEVELVHRLINTGWQLQRIGEFLGRSKHFIQIAREARP